MSEHRFVGAEANVYLNGGWQQLNRFGQSVDLTDDQAEHLKSLRGLFLPATDFAAFKFSEDELKKYPNSTLQARAPQEFQEKRDKAVAAARAWHEPAVARVTPIPAPTVQESHDA